MSHNQKLYIETVGCQMNVLDSELVVAALRQQGYVLTDDMREADTVLFNTCSVREHAEHKIYSQLGRLKFSKRTRPEQVIGVIGCMAQKDQQLIFDRAPHVDMVVGTGQLGEIPRLIEEARTHRRPALAVSLDRKGGSRSEVAHSFESYDPLRDPEMRPSPWQAYVRIMFGCDKFCTYCVVPMTRGPEQSRAPAEIVREVRALTDHGVQEVTLLGQTVNSYKFNEGGRQQRLSDLLHAIHDTPGLKRIKFVTNFPKDMTDDLLQAIRDLPKVARYLHVPLQSGCDEVLKRMKRGYTVADYREMMHRIAAILPGCAVSSDFIVGFCGESEESFQKTVDAVREFRFKNSFIFKYSPRPGTKADELWSDDIPEDVKRRRNNELLAVQTAISEEDNAEFIGRVVQVLVEGPSKRAQKSGEPADANQNYPMPGVVESVLAAAESPSGLPVAPAPLNSPPALVPLSLALGAPRDHDHDHDHDDRGCGTDCGGTGCQTVPPGESVPPGETVSLAETVSPAEARPAAESPTTRPTQLVGRTPCDRIVVFDGNPRLAGTLADVQVFDCTPTTLLAAIVTREIQHGSDALLPILM